MSQPTDTRNPTAVAATTPTASDLMLAEFERKLPVPPPLADEQQRLAACMNEIDLSDSNSILFFGVKAQEQLTTISDRMLEGVRNKDVGPAGNTLNEMVSVLRGFKVDELDPNKPQGFFARLFGKVSPLATVIQQYETVRNQIDTITDQLDRHKTTLLTDIVQLDRLYDANLDYFRTLELYIKAGEAKLNELDTQIIPALEQQVAGGDMVDAQKLRDLRSARDDLDRRIHDLRLTRQVTMQSLPSIRLVQENDKGLVGKINSTLVNTVPLWRQQLAQAITIFRSGEAARTVKAATDLTNDLLAANATNLREANKQAREQIERGVFDIETVKKANAELIATIEDSLRIADDGRRQRQAAVAELETAENELRQTLAAARARTTSTTPPGRS